MLHTFQNTHGHKVAAASEVVEVNDSKALVIASGVNGETNAELIVSTALKQQGITSVDDVIVFWSTPASASVTGNALLRRLHTDGSSLEWGPNLQLTDALQVHAAAERVNAEVEANAG